jgi:flagellar biosynthesis anti-sigma factor FlgM
MTDLNPTGKINRQDPINKQSKKINHNVPSLATAASGSDRVTLSEASLVKSPVSAKGSDTGEIRRDLVQKFRTILANGTYEVKADEIADKIVQKIRENKDRLIF